MKFSYLIITSLGLNAFLVAGVVHQRAARPAAEEAAPVAVAPAKPKKAPAGKAETLVVEVPGEPFSWGRVEAADYHRYVKNLRAIGCPEETVQDIIYSDVTKLYAEKLKALGRQTRSVSAKDYWKMDETYSYNSEWNRKYRELNEEKKALLIELLGVDIEKLRRERQGYPDYEAMRYSYLSEEKRKQVEEIRMRFQDLEQATYKKYQEYYGDERSKELADINKQREAELAKVLTPSELEEYKLRNSQVATQLKYDLMAFEPSEQEFRALFKLNDSFSEAVGQYRFRGPDPDDPEDQKRWTEANKRKDEEIMKVLGDDRYKEYTRAKDYAYRDLYQMAQRSGLPKETAAKVYDMKDAIEKQASKVRSDQTLSAEQKQQALTEMKNLAEKTVQETLGEKNFKSYQSRSGYWMRNLAPTTRTTTLPPGAVIVR